MLNAVRGMGIRYAVPSRPKLDRRVANADRPGEHMWILTAAWAVSDPERPEMVLDAENILEIAGPGCFKCELEYSRKLARRPCAGSMP